MSNKKPWTRLRVTQLGLPGLFQPSSNYIIPICLLLSLVECGSFKGVKNIWQSYSDTRKKTRWGIEKGEAIKDTAKQLSMISGKQLTN